MTNITSSKPFRFLDLPPELREQIYQEVLRSDTPIPLTPDGLAPDEPSIFDHFPLNLLLTCNQIYHEIRPLYFTLNTFSLLLHRNPNSLQYFFSDSFRPHRYAIRRLRLTINRWGANNFFLRTLAPCLSSMILHGQLRHLEVRIRRSHYLEFCCAEETMKTLDQRCGPRPSALNLQGLLALRGICEDPDLETVVLKTYKEPRRREGDSSGDEAGLEDVSHVLNRDRIRRIRHYA